MIFGKLNYTEPYEEKHDKVLSCLKSEFKKIQEGLQGDSWIWVIEKNEKVAVDTFTAMQHEIKCSNKYSTLVKKVIETLKKEFDLEIYENPELEAHE
jgi:hypothetical protein